jgi:branched-chain amino acid transport system substrate-binding protein
MARTGIMAVATPPQQTTYDLWREQVNAAGGLDVGGKKRQVEFVSYDDQSNPGQAVRIYEKLITDDKVDLLLAPWGTPFHIAIAPVLEVQVPGGRQHRRLGRAAPDQAGLPVVSDLGDSRSHRRRATAMMKAADVKSAAIVSNVPPFSKEIKNFLEPELKKAGIELKHTSEYLPDVKDMTATLTQVKQANVDAVIALAYPGDAILYAKQAKELGLNAPFQFIAIGPTAAFFAKVVGASSAEDVVTIAHWTPRPDWKGSQAFYDAYVKKYGEAPDYLDAALPWMSLEILQSAVARAGLDKEKIRDIISKDTFETINGKVRFEGVQNVITPTAFVQMQKGKLQLVWPKSIATGQYEPKKAGDRARPAAPCPRFSTR